MDPVSALALASGLFKLGKELMAELRASYDRGEVPDEIAAQWRKDYESLRNELGGEYQGSHWDVSGR